MNAKDKKSKEKPKEPPKEPDYKLQCYVCGGKHLGACSMPDPWE